MCEAVPASQHAPLPAALRCAAGAPHILFNADNSSDVLYSISHSPGGPLAEAFFEGLAGLGWDYASLDRIHPLQVSGSSSSSSRKVTCQQQWSARAVPWAQLLYKLEL